MSRPAGIKNKPGSKKTGPKMGKGRTQTVKLEDREVIARLHRRGMTQHEIAKEVGYSQPMVSLELKAIREMYAAATVQHREALVAEHCAAMDDVIREAYAAWEVSKKEIEKWVQKTFGPQPCYKCKGEDCPKCEGTGMVTPSAEEVLSKEGRVPGAEYMRLVIDARKQQAQLLGILGVGNVNIDARTQTVNMPGGLDWRQLAQQFFDPSKAGPPAENGAEAKVKAVLDKPTEQQHEKKG